MNFDLSDEQRMLFDHALELLRDRSDGHRLRALIAQGEEWDAALWRDAADAGFLGVALPESHGGMGQGWLDMGLISEALGRVSAALPVFSSSVLVAQALALAGSERQKDRWLRRLITGECVATLAYAEGLGSRIDAVPRTRCDAGRLFGAKQPVADAGIASLCLVLAAVPEGRALVLVELDQVGVTRRKLESFDALRAHYALSFDGVEAERLPGSTSAGFLDRLFDRAAIQAAFEAIGGADACLAMARDHAMERRIFGRSLASYQAIKHKLADILVSIELARSNAYFAAWAADHDPAALPRAAAAARLMAIDAFERAARENMQVHGGMAYTIEADCHFFYRRERTLALSLEGREFWAERLLASVPTADTAVEA